MTIIIEQQGSDTLPIIHNELSSGPIGAFFVAQGLCSYDAIHAALERQQRTGGRLGEILQADVGIRALDYYRALSKFYGLAFVNLVMRKPDPTLLMPDERAFYAHHLVLPVYRDNDAVVVATSDPSEETFSLIRCYWGVDARIVVTSKFDLFWTMQSMFDEVYTDEIISELQEKYPEKSALRTFTKGQVFSIGAAVALYLLLIYVDLPAALLVMNATISISVCVVLLYKFYLAVVGFSLRRLAAGINSPVLVDAKMPVYTILVPMYHERRTTVENLVASLRRLDYPTHKLDIKLVVEADDPETTNIIKSLNLPSRFEIVRVPPSEPRTKPKACNYALKFARGEYITIYDAEDEPDPGQLKHVVRAFKAANRKRACVQCALNYYNSRENWITRMFTMEYTFWFDLMLPAMGKLRLPMPLGGTSNHFRTEFLKQMIAWDPFNVTEDADLGIRMSRLGYESCVLSSTTYEEATSGVVPWIKQRSRWIKGYMQTYLVHMRQPLRLYRELSGRGFAAFQLFIGGTVLSNLMNLPLWLILIASLLVDADIGASPVIEVAWINFIVGNILLLGLNVLAVLRRNRYDLAVLVVTAPLYWLLASVASYRALYQLIYNPSYWDKTQHGVSTYVRSAVPPAAALAVAEDVAE